MGGMVFAAVATGCNAREAFNNAVELALEENGNQGYSGTIAEKDSFLEFPMPEQFVGQIPEDFSVYECDDLVNYLEEHSPYSKVFDDKWGPAVCIQLSSRSVTTTQQVGVSVNETALKEPKIAELAYRIVSQKKGKVSLSETSDLEQATKQARKLALEGADVTVTAYYEIEGNPIVYEANAIFEPVVKPDGLRTYLFTGYASC